MVLQKTTRAWRDPLFYAMVLLFGPLLWYWGFVILDRTWPFEVNLNDPVLLTPGPLYPGDSVRVQWLTRIQRSGCDVTYARELRREGSPPYRLGTHKGHKTQVDTKPPKPFVSEFRLPEDLSPGHWFYVVTAFAKCSPLTTQVLESPSVPIDVVGTTQ